MCETITTNCAIARGGQVKALLEVCLSGWKSSSLEKRECQYDLYRGKEEEEESSGSDNSRALKCHKSLVANQDSIESGLRTLWTTRLSRDPCGKKHENSSAAACFCSVFCFFCQNLVWFSHLLRLK